MRLLTVKGMFLRGCFLEGIDELRLDVFLWHALNGLMTESSMDHLDMAQAVDMPMTLLTQLCAAEVAIEVCDQDEIRKLAVLRSAALGEAEIPPVLVEDGCCRYMGPALLRKVTNEGRAAARTHERM